MRVEVEIAYVKDGSAHVDLLHKALGHMDDNTPTLAEERERREDS